VETLRYLHSKERYLDYALDICKEYFMDRKAFGAFFDSIPNDEDKDRFLQVTSFYKFLVRDGDFYNKDPRFDTYIEYLDITYKYIAIVSLIEALYSKKKHIDFYEWMVARSRKGVFPIQKRSHLATLYRAYKKEYGVIQSARKFFHSLDDECKDFISRKFEVKGKKRFLDLIHELYNIRSKFIHEARLVLEFGSGTVISSTDRKAMIVSQLDLGDLRMIFEHGLLRSFGYSERLSHPPVRRLGRLESS
jgi:hypothetical protein